jgi:molybdenum cofactor cytidylyltransferase
MVAVTVANALESELDRVVVVTGHHAQEVSAAVADLGVEVVENPDYRLGNMTSLRSGFLAVPHAEAYVILLADMPDVDADIIDRFVRTWRDHGPWAAVAGYSDGRAHPLLLSSDAMQQAIGEEGPKAVWRLLAGAPSASVVDVPFDTPAPVDVNTPGDYDAVRES